MYINTFIPRTVLVSVRTLTPETGICDLLVFKLGVAFYPYKEARLRPFRTPPPFIFNCNVLTLRSLFSETKSFSKCVPTNQQHPHNLGIGVHILEPTPERLNRELWSKAGPSNLDFNSPLADFDAN